MPTAGVVVVTAMLALAGFGSVRIADGEGRDPRPTDLLEPVFD